MTHSLQHKFNIDMDYDCVRLLGDEGIQSNICISSLKSEVLFIIAKVFTTLFLKYGCQICFLLYNIYVNCRKLISYLVSKDKLF